MKAVTEGLGTDDHPPFCIVSSRHFDGWKMNSLFRISVFPSSTWISLYEIVLPAVKIIKWRKRKRGETKRGGVKEREEKRGTERSGEDQRSWENIHAICFSALLSFKFLCFSLPFVQRDYYSSLPSFIFHPVGIKSLTNEEAISSGFQDYCSHR